MADKKKYVPVKEKKRDRVSELKQAQKAESKAKKGKRNKSTYVILGALLLVVILYAVSNISSRQVKYDVYALNSEFNFEKIKPEYTEFLRRVADINESLPEVMESDEAPTKILEYADELLAIEVPDKLIGVKAAEFDMLNYHYKYAANTIDAETLAKAKQKVSIAFSQVN
ncbi:MAG: hypothetical protein LBM16_05155 [Clostridiales bacterium]|jgi:hypothetical protein|nr:hypothetical protein [Clostridiales bacterium]